MPEIGALHPQVVHFVVASLILGLPLYWLGFVRKLRFLRSTASVLLVVGAVASMVAVESGHDAHGPAERIPGTRDVVVHHEELGELTSNIFVGIVLLELLGLGLAWKAGPAGESTLSVETGELVEARASTLRFAATATSLVVAVGWTVGAIQLYETAEHGGEIVYEHAGGVGFRGDVERDVPRLLLAGLYHQSRLDREAGRSDEAARLVEEMARRFPGDPDVQLLRVESLVQDRQDGRGALDALAGLEVDENNASRLLRRSAFAFDAYMLLGLPDSARAALDQAPERFRDGRTVSQRRARLEEAEMDSGPDTLSRQ